MKLFCDNCAALVRANNHECRTWCSICGRVLSEDSFMEEVTFVKTADGQSRMAGNFVRSIQEENSESRKRTVDDAYYGIKSMMGALGIDGGEDKAHYALRLYELALNNKFTRGRRKELVLAACLYIMCSYVLGAIFLQLCKALSLVEHPIFQRLVDPSLFIHRFADRLFEHQNRNVSRTALHIVASMKRDWMQTGRKPSGLCGAALYISALAYGLKCSKSEIIKAVHICEATLTKRLIEFEITESGGLTIEEFEKKSKEFDDQADKFGTDESQMKSLNTGQKASGSGELLCEHKGSGRPQFAYGLCNDCYKEFMILSGGLNGGSEPPAFQRAERKRTMAKEAASDISQNLDSSMLPGPTSDEQRSIKNTIENDVIQPAYPDSTGATFLSNTMHDTINNRMDASDFTLEESENLSDIEDTEVDPYILDEKEKNCKTTVWEEINKEYLEEQAEKEAAKKAYEAIFSNCSEDVEGARKLAAAVRKEKRQKRAADLNNLGPPQTAAEAAKQMLERKGLSSRFRQDKMDEMFGSDDQSAKKSRIEPEPEPEHDDDYLDDKEEDPELDGNGEANANYTEEYNYDQDYNDMADF